MSTLEQDFQHFIASCYRVGIPDQAKEKLREAFMAGASKAVLKIKDTIDLPPDMALPILDGIDNELLAYANSKTGGNN